MKKVIMLRLCSIWILASLLSVPVFAGTVEPRTFDSSQQEADYRQLIEELRCLVCQNQNIADSNADLAKDLRREAYNMLKSGKSQDEVVDFMVARYGDFVLYRPPLNPSTWLLWGAPLLLAIIGLAILFIKIRGRSRRVVTNAELSSEEQARLKQMLANDRQE